MTESLIEKARYVVHNDPPSLVSDGEYRRIIAGLLRLLDQSQAIVYDALHNIHDDK